MQHKIIILLTLFLSTGHLGAAQGYRITFEQNIYNKYSGASIPERIAENGGKEVILFINDNQYAYENTHGSIVQAYFKGDEYIYLFRNGNFEKFPAGEEDPFRRIPLDSTVNILGKKCNSYQYLNSYMRVIYFTPQSHHIDPQAFDLHSTSAFKSYLHDASGAIPLKLTMESDSIVHEFTATQIEPVSFADKKTKLPAYARKQAEDLLQHYVDQKARHPHVPSTFTAKGKGRVNNFELTFDIYLKEKAGTRMEMGFMGGSFIYCITDTLTWEYNPMENTVWYTTEITENAGAWDKYEHSIEDADEVEYTGLILLLDSIPTYELQVTSQENTEYFYLDTLTYQVVYHTMEDSKFSWGFESQDHTWIPRYMYENESDMLIQFHSYIIDEPLSDSLFQMPPDKPVKQKYAYEFDTYTQVIDSLIEHNSNQEAAKWIERGMQDFPEKIQFYLLRGKVKLYTDDVYGAIGDFNTTIENRPHDAVAFNFRGYAKAALGDHKNALPDYDMAISLDSVYINAHWNRAISLYHLSKQEEAFWALQTCTQLDPSEGKYPYNMGLVMANDYDNLDSARYYYEEALEKGYREADVYNRISVVYYHEKNFELALCYLDTALSKAPENSVFKANRGEIMLNLDRYKEALRIFEKLIRESEDVEANWYNKMGIANFRMENFKAAERAWSQAIDINQKNAEYFDNRAAAREALGNWTGAIDDYTRSLQLFPNDPKIFYRRGMAKLSSNMNLEGCLDLSKAHDMGYEDAEAAIIRNCD